MEILTVIERGTFISVSIKKTKRSTKLRKLYRIVFNRERAQVMVSLHPQKLQCPARICDKPSKLESPISSADESYNRNTSSTVTGKRSLFPPSFMRKDEEALTSSH